MGWIPKTVVTAGLLAGMKLSAGSLQGLWDAPSLGKSVSGNFALGSKANNDGFMWSGAFGLLITDDLLDYAYQKVIASDTGHWALLAEIEIPNPEGAQYYKQSYAVEILIDGSSGITENTRTVGTSTYHCKWLNANMSFKIQRYQYDHDPYTYTATNISNNSSRNIQACKILEGDSSDIYYAFGGGWVYDRILLPYGYFTNNNIEYFGCALYCEKNCPSTQRVPTPPVPATAMYGMIGQSLTYLDQIFGDFELPEEDDPNDDPNNPGNEEDGGDGDHDRPVVPIPVPDLPVVGAANAGFITMYKLAPADMWVFGQEFFVRSIFDAIKLLFANPIDVLIGVMMLPFIPEGNEMWYPKVGDTYLTLHPLCKVSKQFYELDCGSIFINEYGRNCFDYSPYTQITIFLPYIGYRELPVDEVMGKNVGVVYHIDVLTGDCIAFVTTQVKGNGMSLPVTVVIAQFNGNCGIQVPAGSVSFDNLVSGAINFACSGMGVLASTALGGYDGGNVGQQISQLTSSTAGMITGMKPTVKRDGVIGSSSGWMSVLTPYIIRHIPNQSLPTGYGTYMGYPSNISGTLGGGFSGFAIVEDIQLNNIPAMETEREEIKELLREGVLL